MLKVENKQMCGQRHQTEFGEDRSDQCGHEQITDGRRQTHAQNNRRYHQQKQGRKQIVMGQRQDGGR